MWEILDAGEWKSAAFVAYLDKHALERDLVEQAHLENVLDSDEDA